MRSPGLSLAIKGRLTGLYSNDPDGFYEKYEVREFWVVDLSQKKNFAVRLVDRLRSSGSHHTVSVAWGPLEGSRRFAVVAYD
jgi:hypothetical protein